MKDKRRKLGRLDVKLNKNQRAIQAQIMDSKNVKEIVEILEISPATVQKNLLKGEVVAPIHAKTLDREQRLVKILEMATQMMETDSEMPVKPSDKLGAARLIAEIDGVLSDKDSNRPVQIENYYDLRTAKEEDLRKEIERLEKERAQKAD